MAAPAQGQESVSDPAASTRASTRASIAILVVAAVAFALVRAPYVSLPLERDEGEYAYIAQRMLAGDVPYRDAFDQKPPGVFLAYLLGFALFGRSVEAIHLFAYVWTLGAALSLHGLVRHLAGGLAAAFAVLLFAVASADPRLYATAANTELFMLWPLVASMGCFVRALEDDRGPQWLATGALAAAACWFKPVAATHALFLGLAVAADAWLQRPREPASRLLRRLGLLSAGSVLASAPLVGWLMAVGAWDAFVDAVVLHNLRYSGALGLPAGTLRLAQALVSQAPSSGVYWLLAAVALAVPRLAGRRSWALLGGWWLAAAAGVATGLYFRPHYFVQVLPALAALGGVTLSALASRCLARATPPLAALGVAALVALALAPPLGANSRYWAAESPTAISRRMYGLNPFPESVAVADYIRQTSAPDDSVLVVGSEPQILFHAERRSATRYIFFYPLTGRYPDAEMRQRELLAEVRGERPRYVVWVHLDASLLVDAETEKRVFHELAEMLSRDYRLEFLAVPLSGDRPFDFVYGREAAPRLRELREQESNPAWVAVYRRAP